MGLGKESGRALLDAHISKSRYGAPGNTLNRDMGHPAILLGAILARAGVLGWFFVVQGTTRGVDVLVVYRRSLLVDNHRCILSIEKGTAWAVPF
jgi:hypothetical protein